MNRMFAIVEREMRKFFRSPTLMIMSLMMPILQLLIMGNAFGGKIVGARVAVVDYDHGPQAVKLREGFDSIAVNIKTFTTVEYTYEVQAREDVRTGKIDGAVIIPAQYSRRVYAQDAPRIGFVVDNTDLFSSGILEAEMQLLVTCAHCARHPAAAGQPDRAGNRRAISLCQLLEVPAPRLHCPGHVYICHDRRRHVVHRRQGPRRS